VEAAVRFDQRVEQNLGESLILVGRKSRRLALFGLFVLHVQAPDLSHPRTSSMLEHGSTPAHLDTTRKGIAI
jgi:hypothetical protein